MKYSAKVTSIIVGAAISIGAIGAAAAVNNQFAKNIVASSAVASSMTASSKVPESSPTSLQASSAVSSAVSSAAISSKGTVSTVTDGIGEIQQETDKAVSRIQKAADDGVSVVKQAQSQTSSKVRPYVSYPVINPQTGMLVFDNDPNYGKYKAELGGDAGTTTTTKSTACQAALKKLHDEYEAKKASSTPIGGNVARQVPYK